MSNSRISRRELRQSKKKLIYSLAGIVFILFLLFKFGIPLLIKFSIFISGTKQDTTQMADQPSFIAPPILNPYVSATNSAQITISGNATSKQTVKLYVNDQGVDIKETNVDGSFSFDNVTLTTGENTIKAKVEKDNKTSDFSNELIISYKNKAPSLDVSAPSDGQSFEKDPSVTVKGKTDPDAKVTVNDFQAIVGDQGDFSYSMQLQNGDNQLKIVAIDSAGNKTEKDLKVTYSQ